MYLVGEGTEMSHTVMKPMKKYPRQGNMLKICIYLAVKFKVLTEFYTPQIIARILRASQYTVQCVCLEAAAIKPWIQQSSHF